MSTTEPVNTASATSTAPRSALVAVVAAVALASAAAIGYFSASSATAHNAINLNAPTQPVVATINLPRTLDSLDEARALARDLEALDVRLKERVDNMVREFESLGEEIRVTPRDSPERLQAEQRFRELRIRIEVEQNIRKNRVEEEYAANLAKIFESIRNATAEVSRRNGYTVVFYDDSTAEVPPARVGVDAVRGIINQRRIGYVDPRHDITQEVIDYMNNQFARRPRGN